MDLIFASHNPNKLAEIRASLGTHHNVLSLVDLGWTKTIPETEDTLAGNAVLKALTVYKELRRDCFADDTGLEIEALGGDPGVRTARFAGENATGSENRAKTLELLRDVKNRRAKFRTVIALVLSGRAYTFEGHINGEITLTERGDDGFSYSPIFMPAGFDKTYAEMSVEQKAQFNHRALAIARMKDFLSLRDKENSLRAEARPPELNL